MVNPVSLEGKPLSRGPQSSVICIKIKLIQEDIQRIKYLYCKLDPSCLSVTVDKGKL